VEVHVCPLAGEMASAVRRKVLVLKLVPPTVTAKQNFKKLICLVLQTTRNLPPSSHPCLLERVKKHGQIIFLHFYRILLLINIFTILVNIKIIKEDKIECSLVLLLCLVWLSSYIASRYWLNRIFLKGWEEIHNT
jgi:hypothetical protein